MKRSDRCRYSSEMNGKYTEITNDADAPLCIIHFCSTAEPT